MSPPLPIAFLLTECYGISTGSEGLLSLPHGNIIFIASTGAFDTESRTVFFLLQNLLGEFTEVSVEYMKATKQLL